MKDPGFGELGDGGNRPSGIYLGFYNKLDLVNRYIDGTDSGHMERMAGAIDPLTATVNQFNPVTMIATAMQNVRVASEVYGTGEGYMWEAQLLQASVMPLRIGGSILVAAGTAAQFVPGPGTVVGGIMIAVGAALSAAGNSIHVDPKTGKRSYQMTDQGAMNTLVDVVGGATGGAVAGNAVAAGNAAASQGAVAAGNAAASQGAVAAANAAAAATKAGSAYAMATMTGLNLVNSGMEYDSDGRYTGHWSLSGERGDNALIGTAIAFASAGTASAMKLQQGTLASDLTRSIFSTGMHMTVQCGKMYAGHDNNYAAMAESDFSDLGSVLGTMMQSQSRDWQNDLADWAKDANDFNKTQRVLDLITGAGVFGRRENGELFYDAPEQAADTAWGRFWEGGMSTLGGYGARAGVIGEGLGAVAGAIGTGLGMAWNVLADGADWLGSKMLSGASWLGDMFMEGAETAALTNGNVRAPDGAASEAIGNWFGEKADAMRKAYDDWRMEDVEEVRSKFGALAAKNEAIARKLNTVDGYNELAEKIYAKQKKDHPDWTYDQHLDAIKLRIDDMKAALINNIAAEDVYINYHQDDVKALDKYERLIFEAQREAMQRSMAAFGMERLSREELKEMGFALNDKDKFSEFETKDGMQSWLYRIPGTSWRKTQYILAFRGTEPSEWGDIAADLGTTGMGVRTAQYTQAQQLAIRADLLVGDKGELSFTGHSLGGGLASLAASVTGKNAITFNAAGVQSTAYSVYGGSTEGIEQRVKAYYLNGDALSAVQDNPIFDPFATLLTPIKYATNWYQGEAVILPAYLPSATGERRQLMAMTGGEVRSNILQRFLRWGALHSNTNVMTSLQRELQ